METVMKTLVSSSRTERAAQVVHRLRLNHSPKPEDLRVILDQAEDARPLLLDMLSECARWDHLPGKAVDGPIHAVFLLAALEAFEAWPILEAILRKPYETFVDPLFDENLLETLPWAAARIALDQPEKLVRLVEDRELTIWVRVCALEALVCQALLRLDRRAFVIERLRDWLRRAGEPDFAGVGNFLAFAVEELSCASELRAEVQDVFAKGLVEPSAICEEAVFAGTPVIFLPSACDIFEVYELQGDRIGYYDPAQVAARDPYASLGHDEDAEDVRP
jgi:hypothetical protein